ncbi:hypothetical protein Runsl_5191 [Runella slithyformis DSM 19594]|uniref:Uncharacterized protein n=1 Tax=Runella slithyformis (strain ATCC 29530 / DSM 19594 / LMG 11500 / NCIMB 11436 / LSU 4) TaxID=761193 RepID=A0A7U4E8A5_RUNSL|nr:hypothetical protein Runsl_5191 [Runella slithyformis DSM 19594]
MHPPNSVNFVAGGESTERIREISPIHSQMKASFLPHIPKVLLKCVFINTRHIFFASLLICRYKYFDVKVKIL